MNYVGGIGQKCIWVVGTKVDKRMGKLEHMLVPYFDYVGVKPRELCRLESCMACGHKS